ncbi:MAG: hypothetical protein U0X91_21605 [Spirosomataceae bacterium]
MSTKVRNTAGHYLIVAITLFFCLLLSCSAVPASSADGSKGQQIRLARQP